MQSFNHIHQVFVYTQKLKYIDQALLSIPNAHDCNKDAKTLQLTKTNNFYFSCNPDSFRYKAK